MCLLQRRHSLYSLNWSYRVNKICFCLYLLIVTKLVTMDMKWKIKKYSVPLTITISLSLFCEICITSWQSELLNSPDHRGVLSMPLVIPYFLCGCPISNEPKALSQVRPHLKALGTAASRPAAFTLIGSWWISINQSTSSIFLNKALAYNSYSWWQA